MPTATIAVESPSAGGCWRASGVAASVAPGSVDVARTGSGVIPSGDVPAAQDERHRDQASRGAARAGARRHHPVVRRAAGDVGLGVQAEHEPGILGVLHVREARRQRGPAGHRALRRRDVRDVADADHPVGRDGVRNVGRPVGGARELPVRAYAELLCGQRVVRGVVVQRRRDPAHPLPPGGRRLQPMELGGVARAGGERHGGGRRRHEARRRSHVRGDLRAEEQLAESAGGVEAQVALLAARVVAGGARRADRDGLVRRPDRAAVPAELQDRATGGEQRDRRRAADQQQPHPPCPCHAVSVADEGSHRRIKTRFACARQPSAGWSPWSLHALQSAIATGVIRVPGRSARPAAYTLVELEKLGLSPDDAPT